MTIQRRCKCCRKRFTPKNNPTQRYCSATLCQRARKRSWEKNKRRQDGDYRENQRMAQQRWLAKNRSYWANYRARQKACSEQQNSQPPRLPEAQLGNLPETAKMDASEDKNTEGPRGYVAFWVRKMDIAKMDALTLKNAFLSMGCPIFLGEETRM